MSPERGLQVLTGALLVAVLGLLGASILTQVRIHRAETRQERLADSLHTLHHRMDTLEAKTQWVTDMSNNLICAITANTAEGCE